MSLVDRKPAQAGLHNRLFPHKTLVYTVNFFLTPACSIVYNDNIGAGKGA
jgi:hypothetical protein